MTENIVIEIETRPVTAEVQISTGLPGPAGPVTDLTVGTVSTGAPGTDAEVTITGSAPNKQINFVIPQAAGGVINSVNGQFGPDVILGAEDINTGVFDIAQIPTGQTALTVALGNHSHTKDAVGLANVDNTSDMNKPVSTATQNALNLKANVANPTFTGTVTGVSKAHVGLGNVDNTSDANKPVSTAQQTALNLKANLASPTFTGTVSGITKAMVGLGSVPNVDTSNAANITGGTLADARLVARLGVYAKPVTDWNLANENGWYMGSSTTNAPNGDSGWWIGEVVAHNNLYMTQTVWQFTGATANDTMTYRRRMNNNTWEPWFKLSLSQAETDARYATLGTTQTITGAKTFTIAPVVPVNSFAISSTSGLQAALDLKAPLASPTFTGTVSGITKTMVGLANVDNTADLDKPISTAVSTALAGKSATSHTHDYGTLTNKPTLGTAASYNVPPTGNATTVQVVVGNDTRLTNARTPTAHTHIISDVENLQEALSLKSPTNHTHSFIDGSITGTADISQLPTGTTNTTVALGNHTHTAAQVGAATPDDVNDAIGFSVDRANHTGTQPASSITGLAAIALSGSASDITTGILPASVLPALAISDVTPVASQAAMLALTAQRGDIAVRTDIGRTYILASDNPAILDNWQEMLSGGNAAAVTSVAGKVGDVLLVKADVGLGNVDNTSDASKPVSTATQTALNLKANLASPTFTGTVSGITKAMVGLGSVDNTADTAKPVSTAQQTALNTKVTLTGNETIAGVKTFSTAPVVPDNSFAIAKTSGLQAALDGKSATSHIHDDRYFTETETNTNFVNKTVGSYFAGHHAEGRVLANAYLTNDLGNLRLRGGSVTVTGTTMSDSQIDNLFDGTAVTVNPGAVPIGSPIVITATLPKTLNYGATLGIGFGAANWHAKTVRIEAFSEGAWKDVINTTTNTSEELYANIPGNAGIGTTQIRVTLADATALRIAHIWGFNYNSDMWTQVIMPRKGGQFYGAISVPSGITGLPTPSGADHAATKGYADTKEPAISAGTTSQWYRGDKTWQSISTAAVDLSSAQTIGGAKAFSSAASFNAGGQTMNISAGSTDHAYIGIYGRTASPGARSGYFGITSGGSTTISMVNEMTNGGFYIAPNGSGVLTVSTQIWEGSARVYSPNNKPAKADVGLANVDNTADTAKPVSTAQQNALNLKANLASPTFTGTVTAPTFSGSGASLTSLNASNLSTGTAPQAVLKPNSQTFVFTTGTEARPTGTTIVEWVGPVQPVNATTNDKWVDTSLEPGQQLAQALPITATLPYAGQLAPPAGWAMAEGAELPIATYTDCYNNLTNNGTVFPYGANTNGSGAAGSTHFRLPNLTTRVPVGYGTAYAETNAIGKTGGLPTHTLDITQIPGHNHGGATTGADGNHTHSGTTGGDNQDHDHLQHVSANPGSGGEGIRVDYVGDGGGSLAYPQGIATGGRRSLHDHNFTTGYSNQGGHQHTISSQGGGLAHNNMQPYIVMRYIIRIV